MILAEWELSVLEPKGLEGIDMMLGEKSEVLNEKMARDLRSGRMQVPREWNVESGKWR